MLSRIFSALGLPPAPEAAANGRRPRRAAPPDRG